jgi:hypothetical protein
MPRIRRGRTGRPRSQGGGGGAKSRRCCGLAEDAPVGPHRGEMEEQAELRQRARSTVRWRRCSARWKSGRRRPGGRSDACATGRVHGEVQEEDDEPRRAALDSRRTRRPAGRSRHAATELAASVATTSSPLTVLCGGWVDKVGWVGGLQ